MDVAGGWMAEGGVAGSRNEGATTPPLLSCLAIKGMGWHWVGLAGGGGGRGQD